MAKLASVTLEKLPSVTPAKLASLTMAEFQLDFDLHSENINSNL